MTEFKSLQDRLDKGDVVILDGAVGTQLQEMGVPMDSVSWAAAALHTSPYTVRRMHELYVKAGADIITTNTYSSARHNLDPLGMGDATRELNLRAVMLAQDARDKTAKDRQVYIAGAISGFGLVHGGEAERALHRHSKPRLALTENTARAVLREQAEILAEAGVDLLLLEGTGSNTHRRWMIEEAKGTGLPLWVGFRARVDANDRQIKTGYTSPDLFDRAITELMPLGGSALAIFHSTISDTTSALDVALSHWQGPIACYPEAERHDYTAAYHDHNVANKVPPAEFVETARGWVDRGVQIVGGCCGIGLPYIRALREGLPRSVPGERRRKAA
ncbi:MAG: homocysteine S-methyltransferase family protein [Alphaproteobacteria bacterium]|nr:homocysteine S-methyltransferase family protein [Alphaproteobacteria bacterium]